MKKIKQDKSAINQKDKYSSLRWAILAIVLIAEFITIKNGLIALVVYILPTIFIFMHGSRFLGRKNIIIFFVTIFIISYITEYLGVSTGKIFGAYYYNLLKQ